MKNQKTPTSAKTDQDIIGELFEYHQELIDEALCNPEEAHYVARGLLELDKRHCNGDYTRDARGYINDMRDFKKCENQFFERGR